MRFHIALLAVSLPLTPVALARDAAHPADHTAAHLASREVCHVERTGEPGGPSADICARIAARWRALMSVSAPPGIITLHERIGFDGSAQPAGWTLEWPLSDLRTRGVARRSDGLPSYAAAMLIPHEAGHEMFITFASDFPHIDSVQYGSPAPDWLDEAVAVWMEPDSGIARRVHSIAGTLPDIARLTTMGNPASESMRDTSLGGHRMNVMERTVTPPCAPCKWLPDSLRGRYRVIDVGLDARGHPDTLVWYSVRSPAKNETLEEREFYALSYSLLAFIRARGGPAAISELLQRYRMNPAARTDVFANLPGLPKTVAAFEAAWRASLR
ncbi:MAG TPA: hypothetical protein VE967_08020 [Gemmatimonadaceae bacterium]|nr:hypothetical protein [Gemmatimonadaceae bacterium]